MSVEAYANVWRYSKNTGGVLCVELALADYCNVQGICWPSVATIAAMTNQSARNVQRVLVKLEQQGKIVRKKGVGPKGSTVYQCYFNPQTRGDKLSGGGDKLSGGGDKLSGDDKLSGVTSATSVEGMLNTIKILETQEVTKETGGDKLSGVTNCRGDASVTRTVIEREKNIISLNLSLAEELVEHWLQRRDGEENYIPLGEDARKKSMEALAGLLDEGRKGSDVRLAMRYVQQDVFWKSKVSVPGQLARKNEDGVAWIDTILRRARADKPQWFRKEPKQKVDERREVVKWLREQGKASSYVANIAKHPHPLDVLSDAERNGFRAHLKTLKNVDSKGVA